MGRTEVPTLDDLMMMTMLFTQFSMITAVLRVKRTKVGDCCTALQGSMACGGVGWGGMGGCSVGSGAALVSPSSWLSCSVSGRTWNVG